MDDERWEWVSGLRWFLFDYNFDLFYGVLREDDVFLGLFDNFLYIWIGFIELEIVRGMYGYVGCFIFGYVDCYGLYFVNIFWVLFDFKWFLWGFGFMVYESIFDDIIFYVDGELRFYFGMDDLFFLEFLKYCILILEVVVVF